MEVRLHAPVFSLYPNTFFRGRSVLLRLVAHLAVGLAEISVCSLCWIRNPNDTEGFKSLRIHPLF